MKMFHNLLVMFCICILSVGDASDGDDVVRFALGLLDHVKTTRLSREVGSTWDVYFLACVCSVKN